MKTLSQFSFAFLFLFIFVQKTQAQTITPEDIVALKTVSFASFSPDGNHIAYAIRFPGGEGAKPGSFHRELWICDYKGQNHRQLTGKPYSLWSLNWDADGDNIYFMSRRADVSKASQLYRISINGGEAEAITEFERSPGSHHFSPDGKMIAYTMHDDLSDEEKANKKAHKDWMVLGANPKYNRLFVMDVEGGESRQIFEQDLDVHAFAWTPDNKGFVFRANEVPGTDNEYMFQKIYRVNLKDGKPSVICDTEGKLGGLAVSPDGGMLAYAGAVDITDPLAQSLFIVPLAGGSPRNLTLDYEGSVNGFTWLNNKKILMHSAEGCFTALYNVSVSSAIMTPVYKKGVIFRAYSVHKETGNIAVPASSPSNPQELYIGNLEDMELTRVTFTNENIEKMKLGKQEVISWKGPDDWNIQGILTYPANYTAGKKYPLLLQIHGGPEGISTNGWNTRAVYPIQWYAANGYFVLEPNYRGSQGRGVAFAKGDHKDLAGKEFDDVLEGIDYLVAKGLVDNDKVGSGGFSYGGYFSAWAATKHSDRFKAAMMGAGISNWISFTGTTDIIYENSYVHWNLMWYDHMKLVWDRSPMAHINNAKTPTLIVHGERDKRVPLGQAYELYNGLKLKDVDTEMVIYKRQPHGILEREAQIDYMNRTLGWFDKYIK